MDLPAHFSFQSVILLAQVGSFGFGRIGVVVAGVLVVGEWAEQLPVTPKDELVFCLRGDGLLRLYRTVRRDTRPFFRQERDDAGDAALFFLQSADALLMICRLLNPGRVVFLIDDLLLADGRASRHAVGVGPSKHLDIEL